MDPTLPLVVSALLLGLMGSGHCVAMCGGLGAALAQPAASGAVVPGGASTRTAAVLTTGLLSLGRIASYVVLGAVVGGLGQTLDGLAAWGPGLRVAAGALIVALGLGRLWPGAWPVRLRLDQLGLAVWRRVAPLAGSLGAGADDRTMDRHARLLLLGALWGWLPCGLVYSALAVAALLAEPGGGAAYLFFFGLGTLPSMWLAGVAARRLGERMRSGPVRWAGAWLLVGFGLWTIAAGLPGRHAEAGHGPGHGAARVGAEAERLGPGRITPGCTLLGGTEVDSGRGGAGTDRALTQGE